MSNITLNNNITRIYHVNGQINTSNKVYLRSQSPFTIYSNNSLDIPITFINSTNCTIVSLTLTRPNATTITPNYTCNNNLLTINLTLAIGNTVITINRDTCTPNIVCDPWSTCNGNQYQICNDGCGNITNTSQSCCVSDWTCGSWTDCSGSEQSKTCIDGCGNTTVETRACTDPLATGGSSGGSGGGGGGSPVYSKLDPLDPTDLTPAEQALAEEQAEAAEAQAEAAEAEAKAEQSTEATTTPVQSQQPLAGQAFELNQEKPTQTKEEISLTKKTFGLASLLILIILAGITFFEKRESNQLGNDKRAELHLFMFKELEKGTRRKEIKKQLRKQGWKRLVVNYELRQVLHRRTHPVQHVKLKDS